MAVSTINCKDTTEASVEAIFKLRPGPCLTKPHSHKIQCPGSCHHEPEFLKINFSSKTKR